MKKLKKISIALVLLSTVSFTACYEIRFDECDCVIVTKNAMSHQNDHEWFMDLDKYCKKKKY